MIGLIGHGRLTVTTKAFDEAGTRVSRQLLMQSLVNLVRRLRRPGLTSAGWSTCRASRCRGQAASRRPDDANGAKTQLSELDLVEDGESVVIERHGRPVAQLVPGALEPYLASRGHARAVHDDRKLGTVPWLGFLHYI